MTQSPIRQEQAETISADGGTGERFRRRHRLRTSADFQRVYEAKLRAGNDVLLVYGLPNVQGHARLGLSVSRKVGNAVKRGRWKRLIREAFRRNRAEIPSNLDLIVIPRPGVVPDHAAVKESLINLSQRLARKIAQHRQSGKLRGKGARR